MGGLKFSIKMRETCDYNEKERVKKTYSSQKTKTLKDLRQETTKIGLDWICQGRIEKRVFEKYKEHVRKLFLKHSLTDFRSVENQFQSIKN